MKRTKKSAVRSNSEPMLPMYTPERAALLERLSGALWEELQASLAAMQRELVAMGGGGEAPIVAGRARVKLMLGAMRGLDEDARLLLVDRSECHEHFRWQDEIWQVMERWLGEFERDVAEYGVDDEDEEDSAYSSGLASALTRTREVWDDWWAAASRLASLDLGKVTVSEIKATDVALRRIDQRLELRRAASAAATD
jgi:hypothetical protein